ncbi:intraflagellar transport protein 43 homolog [Protopterus annectens]|uniref:intraflagellar transport protein 43 homolog n=1 Tax=Protopterus annectens TaxID=7888 RepID=UPI001CFBEAC1|nr:intraflagellar transport protein 43 homolog [Protopterus annectens]
MEEHFDLGDNSIVRRSTAKTGRRAHRPHDALQEESQTAGRNSGDSSVEVQQAKPTRRQGGWADDASSLIKSSQRVTEEVEDHRLKQQSIEGSDDDGDIPVIPDLEEVQEEGLTMQVAAPPSVQVNRVLTFRDLDNDLMKHAAFQTLDGEIDLKLLTKVLSPEQEVREEDVSWDWNHLFTDVSSELLTEWDIGQGEKEDSQKLSGYS